MSSELDRKPSKHWSEWQASFFKNPIKEFGPKWKYSKGLSSTIFNKTSNILIYRKYLMFSVNTGSIGTLALIAALANPSLSLHRILY